MLQGSLVRFLPWTQSFFQLSLFLFAVQPTDDIMVLSGWNFRQTTNKQQDSRLTSKHLETALIYDGYVELTYSSLKLFDLYSENGHLLYQILSVIFQVRVSIA